MKKLLFLVFTLGISLLCLFSCASDVTIYSKTEDLKASVIIADLAEGAEAEGYNSICNALVDLIGRSGFYNKTDVYLEAPGEIIVGHTNRTASAKAEALLAASYYDDGDTEAYVIYVYNGSVAIVASSDFALPIAVDYFIENYLVEDKLVVKSDLVELKTFSVTAYKAALDAELSALSDAEFARRWDEATAKLPPEAVDALKRFYGFYGTDWATWLFNLYDPETGCFYYSNSARDYEGFYVDVESSNQALDILYHAGLFTEFGNVWVKALPASMRAKCLAYVQAMQDPDDGYFYHPQWGKDIGSSRRGRDLGSAMGLISRMGGKPLYDTALDNLGDQTGPVSSVISSFMDTDSHKSTVAATVDERFQSEEKMKEYLDNLVKSKTNSKGYFNSYEFGHTLSSETSQIKAAGLGEFVCDYIDTLQNPETGFFEEFDPDDPDAGYQAASGVIKVGAFYGSVRPIRYGEKMLDTIIEIILNPRPAKQITYVFNPWGALSSAISSIRASNRNAVANGQPEAYSETKLLQKIYTKLPDLINVTIEKLTPYKHQDGSFSYCNDGTSLVNNQGVITSLGYNEGDVNGTTCAMHYILNALYGCINIEWVPMLKYSDYIQFRDIVENSGSVVKQQVPMPELLDFEDYDGTDLPPRVTGAATSPGEKLEVIDFVQKNGEEGKVLAIHSIASKHIVTNIEAKHSLQTMQCFTFSFDLYVDFADTADIYQINFKNKSTNGWVAYMLNISVAGGVVRITDSETNTGSKYVFNDLEITEKTDTWFNLKFEYYVIRDEVTGKTTAKIKVYKNDVCVKVSDNYFVNDIKSISANQAYLSDKTGTVAKPAPITSIDSIEFFARVSPASKIMIDNVDCIPSSSAIFSDADVVPGAGLMIEPDTIVNETVDFESGELDPELFSGTNGFFTAANKATTDNADNLAYKLSAAADTQRTAVIGIKSALVKRSVFTFEADLCVDDFVVAAGDGGAFQLIFSNAFMLSLNVKDGKVGLATWNSTGSAAPIVDLGVSVDVGTWFNLKLEYYPVSEDEAHIVAYINGVKTGESDAYYNKASGKPVVESVNGITIYDRVATDASLYIDNIKCSYDATRSYTPANPEE